jgi:type II secretory pathway pseudopilin PulG
VALLEVVLALAVFFGVAVTILGGLSVCMRSATQVREEAQAADLAVTVLSEVQMGMLEAVDAGPTPFEDPFADWTWQTVAVPVEATVPGMEMTQIQIIVKNTIDGYMYRIYELLPIEEDLTTAQASDTADSSMEGGTGGGMGGTAGGGTSSGDLPGRTSPSRDRSGRGAGGEAGGVK